MDPLTLGLGAVSLGMQLFGGLSAASDTKKAYGIQQNITGLEGQVNTQRQAAMELSARRQSLESFRSTQRAQAQGMNTAVAQGAQFGSGVAGGQAQITAQGAFNNQGINQNLELGRNIFGLNDQISKQKLALSGVQSDISTDQGWASLGQGIGKNAGTISQLAQTVGGKINLSGIGFNPISGATG